MKNDSTVVNIAENMINSIGNIKMPVKVNSNELTFSVNPKVDLSNINLKDFSISQIEISDTEVGISFDKSLGEVFGDGKGDVKINFSVDSKLKDFTKSVNENGTKISFDIAGTSINQRIDLSVGVSDTLLSLTSPSKTNDFELTLGAKIKL